MVDKFFANRERAIYTCCIFLSTFAFGWARNLFGPALLDIQDRTNVDFSSSATYLTAQDIGEIFGSLFVGVCHLKLTSSAMLAIASLVMAITVAVLPWCNTYLDYFILCLIFGIPLGLQRSLQLAELSAIWSVKGSAIIVLTFFLRNIGHIASIMITAPFLSSETVCGSHSACTNITNASSSLPSDTPSYLYIPFSISSCLLSSTSIVFGTVYIMTKKGKFGDLYEATKQSLRWSFSFVENIIAYCSIILISACQTGILHGCSRFISSFIVQQFNLSRKNAAYVGALYVASGLVGRFITFLVIPYFNCYKIVLCNSMLLVIGSVLMFLASYYDLHISFVCCTVALIAIAIYPNVSLLPVVIEKTLFPVTKGVANVLTLSGIAGDIISSLLKGFLIQYLGSIQFTVILIFESVLAAVIYMCLFCLTNNIRPIENGTDDAVGLQETDKICTNMQNKYDTNP